MERCHAAVSVAAAAAVVAESAHVVQIQCLRKHAFHDTQLANAEVPMPWPKLAELRLI